MTKTFNIGDSKKVYIARPLPIKLTSVTDGSIT